MSLEGFDAFKKKLTNGVKAVGDAEQRGCDEFILNGLLNLGVRLGVNTARGFVLNKWFEYSGVIPSFAGLTKMIRRLFLTSALQSANSCFSPALKLDPAKFGCMTQLLQK